jgi:hypothetical protein
MVVVMKNIRRGVFETNSSSTHSISIAANTAGLYVTLMPDADGVITLTGGEFGWGQETYYDAHTKASYCALDTTNDLYLRQLLVDTIKNHTGAKDVVFDFSDDYKHPNYSYIDHQSHGTSHEAFSNEQTLKDFIFNPNSYLETDNDNH